MLSVVIPFYNEIESIDPLLKRTTATLAGCGIRDYEILVVDNGSHENQRLEMAKRADPHVKVLSLSRNFGYQGALWAGLDYAQGDPIVFMDGDGEDPPEVIAEMIKKWKEGYHVAYGVRLTRQTGWFANRCYKAFYRILSFFSEIDIPLDAGEFSLISGPALKAVRRFQDRTRMLRILRAWVGFRQVGVPYHREARIAGKSKFSFLGAFAFAWDGFVSATNIPVRMSIYCAMTCSVIAVIGTIYYFFWYFYSAQKIPGFASLNITILFLFAILFVCFSVLAQYVTKLLDETRRRPPYLLLDGSEDRGDRD